MDKKTEKMDTGYSISESAYIYQFMGSPFTRTEVILKSVPVERNISKNVKNSTFSSCN